MRAGCSISLEQPFELAFDFSPDTAEVAITYHARIPLNPLLTEPYEMSTVSFDPEDINVDTLWLRLIKYRRDKGDEK